MEQYSPRPVTDAEQIKNNEDLMRIIKNILEDIKNIKADIEKLKEA